MKSVSLEEGSAFRIENDLLVNPPAELVLGFGSRREIEVPQGIGVICVGAFAWRVTICKVFIPATVEIIRAHAFSNCWTLGLVVFEEDSRLRTIESSAFIACRQLKSIEIPKRVETLGAGCFSECGQLAAVEFKGEAGIKRIETKAFAQTAIRRVCLPGSVEAIGRWAFPATCEAVLPWPDGSQEFAQWRERCSLAFDFGPSKG
jgi:hypothetical protein